MSVHRSLSVIFAAVAVLGATASFAQDIRIPVGDLRSQAGARDFDRRVERAAESVCDWRVSVLDLHTQAACIAGARKEALDQLSPSQRQALVDALGPAAELARAAR
jgi:UrcA family protein